MKPNTKPNNPRFSSGPCAKRPGWSPSSLEDAFLGRSHRSGGGRAKLREVIDRTRSLLNLPEDYRCGIVPASDTGAVEMALWSLLGARPVTVMGWESFGKGWVTDVTQQLKLDPCVVMEAEYGELPDLDRVDFDSDVVFTWNGTTSGVRVASGDWIPDDRSGLTICDATSAVFSMDLPWNKLDVVTFSWQKVLGGEGAHGMLILSPRAVERLESYTPPWPMPKIFRMTKGGKLNEKIFVGDTINTPSLLCVEDVLDSLKWAESLGGVEKLMLRSESNLAAVAEWVDRTPWVDFLARSPETRSCTSICMRIVDPAFNARSDDEQRAVIKKMVKLLEEEGAGYDLGAYRDAPPGLRLWGGATVERGDLEAVFPWLDWAYAEAQ